MSPTPARMSVARLRRLIPMATYVLLLSAIGSIAVGVPSAAAARPSRCTAVRGKRLAHTRSLTVIARTQGERREYAYICVPPHGRVHLAGWAFDETVTASFSVHVAASAGTWAAIVFASQVDPHGGEELGKMCNAATGRCYRFFHAFTYGGTEFEEASAAQPGLESVAVNGDGEMLLAETVKGNLEVVAVHPNGEETTLDSAPEGTIKPSSLKLAGHQASWVDAGTPKSAQI